MKDDFVEQARLMLRILPHVAAEDCFALKGGTGINFFVRDMPRLSVDIDLTYLPVEPRPDSLSKIGQALGRTKRRVLQHVQDVQVQEGHTEGTLYKLTFLGKEGPVKVEPNLILRGDIYGSERRAVSPKAEEKFEMAFSVKVLSLPDLFGGKICAALDRQHPRDFYDIKLLLESEGLTPEIRKAFVVYWVSHDRPMHELIDPTRRDFREIYEKHFLGMTDDPIGYDSLVQVREELIRRLQRELTDEERRFIVSVKEGKPQWTLLDIEGLDKLPAIQWKLLNIRKMPPDKHREHLRKLREGLGLS